MKIKIRYLASFISGILLTFVIIDIYNSSTVTKNHYNLSQYEVCIAVHDPNDIKPENLYESMHPKIYGNILCEDNVGEIDMKPRDSTEISITGGLLYH